METVNVPFSSLLHIAEPLIINVIRDIVISYPNDSTLKDIKDLLYNQLSELTGKQHFYFDSDIESIVLQILRDNTQFQSNGHILINAVQMWVSSDKTYFDAEKILPVINIFLEVIGFKYFFSKETKPGDMPYDVSQFWIEKLQDPYPPSTGV